MKEKKSEIIGFKTQALFKQWLAKHHAKSEGIWLRIFKKGSGEPTLTYDEALEEALCYGWIDGLKKSYDEKSWIQRFTPRRSKSVWSQRNTKIVQTLIDTQRMQAAGLKVVEAAKADGRWAKAYPSPKNMEIPKDFLKELKKYPPAHDFFQSLSRSYLYTITFQIHNAKKEETRKKRIQKFIDQLKKGEKPN